MIGRPSRKARPLAHLPSFFTRRKVWRNSGAKPRCAAIRGYHRLAIARYRFVPRVHAAHRHTPQHSAMRRSMAFGIHQRLRSDRSQGGYRNVWIHTDHDVTRQIGRLAAPRHACSFCDWSHLIDHYSNCTHMKRPEFFAARFCPKSRSRR
jgi:hypothetical protein